MRAAVYVRVSTEDQARHGYSLAEQRAACEARARADGAVEIMTFSDEGVSGEVLDRPGLVALREAVQDGRVGAVFVRDADRLSRDMIHQHLLVREFEEAGARVVFLNAPYDASPEGRLSFAVLSAVAEFEKNKIKQRMVRGKLQKARQGRMPLGPDIYGYRYDAETDTLHVREDEAAVVREIFRLFTEENSGINGIAERLNAMGVPTKRRGRGTRGVWHKETVRQILHQSAYMGVFHYGRRECRNMGRNRPRELRGKPVPRPKEAWIPIQVPAIVSPDTWARAAERLERARRLWAGSPRQRYLLSGLVTCADCGNPMGGMNRSHWGGKFRAYCCYRSTAGARHPGCRPTKAVRADLLEEAVWNLVMRWVWDPDEIARCMADEQGGQEALAAELDSVARALENAERGRRNLLAVLAAGVDQLDAQMKAQLDAINARRRHLERRKAEIERALANPAPPQGVENLRLLLARPLDEAIPLEERQAVARALIREITVSGRGQDMRVIVHPAFGAGAVVVPVPLRASGTGR